jgi:hypothetical protein
MVKHNIAQNLIDGEVCKKDVVSLQAAYNDCAANHHPALQFWQQPTVIIGGFTVAFSFGAIFGLTHCFGLCK